MSLTGALSRVPLAPALWGLDEVAWQGTTAERATRYGLISAWNLDEASGNRADSFGTNTLTDNNTVTSNPGVGGVGTAAQFTAANSEYLTIADNASLGVGTVDAWWSGWAYFDSLGDTQRLISQDSGLTPHRDFIIMRDTSNRFLVLASPTGAGAAYVTLTASTFGAVSLSTWYHWFVYHRTGIELGIAINGGAFQTLAYTGGIADGSPNFDLGRYANGGGNFMNGRQAAVGMGKSPPGGLSLALAAEIRTYLRNGGTARLYPAGWP